MTTIHPETNFTRHPETNSLVCLVPLSFTDVYAGWPGSISSASVLCSSDLYLKAEDRPDGYLFPREVSGSAGLYRPAGWLENMHICVHSVNLD